MDQPSPDQVDPERKRGDAPFDQTDHFTGEDYDIGRERAEGAKAPSGTVVSGHPSTDAHLATEGNADLPPDAGHRAWADPKTGEVHGSGAGAGGGNSGEDYESESAGGSDYPKTGKGSADERSPGDLGPKNDKAGYL